MTYLDRYKEKHPGLSDEECRNVMICECPHTGNGLSIVCPEDLRWSACHLTNKDRCPICWNREIPGTEPTNRIDNNEREENTMNKNFTKADLKVGYVVKQRNGNLRMVMPYVAGLVLTTIDGQWLNLDIELNDDLTEKSGIFRRDGIHDVMEVYGLSRFGNSTCKISTEYRELLWKREEKPAKKMTVSEIEKILGYKVEVIADEK